MTSPCVRGSAEASALVLRSAHQAERAPLPVRTTGRLIRRRGLASGSAGFGSDNSILLWDPRSLQEITRLEVDAAVLCLAALPDGRLAAGDQLSRLHWLKILD
jgi:hypothetical protein